MADYENMSRDELLAMVRGLRGQMQQQAKAHAVALQAKEEELELFRKRWAALNWKNGD